MDCELCGKPATMRATVEGAKLAVCANCAKHSTDSRPLPQALVKKKSTSQLQNSSSSQHEQKEELVESVRPDIAKLLRLHREKLKLNQEQFAAKLQIRASTYHHYESGAVTPDITTARKLEHELKLPVVVHIRMSAAPSTQHEQDARAMQIGDFFKKKR